MSGRDWRPAGLPRGVRAQPAQPLVRIIEPTEPSDPHRCPACDHHDLEVVTTSLERAAASVGVLGERVTVRHCACGHRDVPAELGRAARTAASQALPAARRRLLRADTCSSCGAETNMPVRRAVRVVSVETASTPVMTLTLDLPMTRCPECGLDQLPARARHDVDAALAALFQGAADSVAGD